MIAALVLPARPASDVTLSTHASLASDPTNWSGALIQAALAPGASESNSPIWIT